MDSNRVEIIIRNQPFTIISSEPREKVIALADEINGKLSEIMKGKSITLTQALILSALDFADSAKTAATEAEKLKKEISSYLEDAEKAMTERDRYKREIEKLKAKKQG